MKKRAPFDKYLYYKKAVQSPKEDIRFFKALYKRQFKKTAHIFREDFCGTFYLSWSWIREHSKNQAIAVDLDKKPLDYGRKHHLSKLSPSQQFRIKIINKNVLDGRLPKAEIINVSNFSYFAIRQREQMLKYFKNVRKSLFKKGLFIIDVLGGPDCEDPSVEIVEHGSFKYYWEQENFDPINCFARYHIHFKRKGERKQKKVFSYNWRQWSIPELRDILKEAGFSKVDVYWEKTGKSTETFRKTKRGEAWGAWIAYLVSQA